MTLLVASIAADTVAAVHALAQEAWTGGADAVELRIDTFRDDAAALDAYLSGNRDRTWIVTCRGAAEGGQSDDDSAERLALLLAATRGTDALVDFEIADFKKLTASPNPANHAAARSLEALRGFILSSHDFSGTPDAAAKVLRELADRPAKAIGKLAYAPSHINDSFAALDVMHEQGERVAAVCMGEEGMWTRLLAGKLGAFATYGALSTGSATAPGQLTIAEMIQRYRWPAIDSSTRVFGVLGNPAAHSMGPALFNKWFEKAGINAIYLPLRVRGGGDSLSRFLDACMERSWLDVGGFSVTLPHKTAALEWAGAGADRMASSIGALNTLVFRDGRASGHNTDSYAAIDSLVAALGCSRCDLAGLPVDVLGTGGAARAVLAGLREFGSKVTVYGRSAENTREIVEKFGCRAAAWEDRGKREGDVLINCTNVGMRPATGESPIPDGSLGGCRLVFDLIYNPSETLLLQQAASEGCAALGGLDMFIRQAAMQFELWTSIRPDTQLARKLVADAIRTRTGRSA